MKPVLRKGRVVRNLAVKIEPTEPPIGQVQLDFLGQLALRALAIAVAYNQHPHHQLRIDRWPADLAVIRPQLRAHTTQHRRHKNVDSSEQVLFRNAIFEPKLIEQTRLIASLPPHHRRLQEADPRNQRNHCSSMFSSLFRQHRTLADSRRVADEGQCRLGAESATQTRATSGNRLSVKSATIPRSRSTPLRPTGATMPNSARCAAPWLKPGIGTNPCGKLSVPSFCLCSCTIRPLPKRSAANPLPSQTRSPHITHEVANGSTLTQSAALSRVAQ